MWAAALPFLLQVILMDINMPRMDGFQATKALRERGLTTPVRVHFAVYQCSSGVVFLKMC